MKILAVRKIALSGKRRKTLDGLRADKNGGFFQLLTRMVGNKVKKEDLARQIAERDHIPHSRRWRVTKQGRIAKSAAVQLRDIQFPISHLKAAA